MITSSSPDLYMGLGSIVYALTKVDGRLQLEEQQTVKELLAGVPHGDVALYTFFLRENTNETVEEAYAFGMRRLTDKRAELNEATKKQFVHILVRVADAHDDISRKEQVFIRQFRRALRRL
ncbi:TerB family tellurite resistance protein [Fibrella sp. HMF5335]|uniref:TerB family tellurite resistance protein n=1 Tax=Fibrella rubiginis TaxID=2817060 RepID=A0A939GFB9_9BACT|nr:TerB family tellurite resistance protein [Fibrella rubiginis]MBO0937291.1 TerB family tellurite resistance protein [Fibrella rubiginis]